MSDIVVGLDGAKLWAKNVFVMFGDFNEIFFYGEMRPFHGAMIALGDRCGARELSRVLAALGFNSPAMEI